MPNLTSAACAGIPDDETVRVFDCPAYSRIFPQKNTYETSLARQFVADIYLSTSGE